jgi:hypothetical protein
MKKVIVGLFAFGLFSAAQAASYQAQGCGLGSTIWTDGSSLMHQVLGATTNGTSGNQTFGMTSGTSNCELDGSAGQAQTVFIEANRASLANDIARGQGETLSSLMRMNGCNNIEAAGSALQQNYKSIFTSEATSAKEINASISGLSKSACI